MSRNLTDLGVLSRARVNGLVANDCDPLSDAEILTLIARPGFSTSSKVTDISGRGVGLDVVATKVRSLGGAVELSTDAGAGTEIRLELPTTLAIIHALLARSENEIYALPITHVVETLVLEPDMVRVEDDREVLRIRGQSIPSVRLRDPSSSRAVGAAVARQTGAVTSLRVVLVLPGVDRFDVMAVRAWRTQALNDQRWRDLAAEPRHIEIPRS